MRSNLYSALVYAALFCLSLQAEEMSMEELTNLEPTTTVTAAPANNGPDELELEAEKKFGEWAAVPWPAMPSEEVETPIPME